MHESMTPGFLGQGPRFLAKIRNWAGPRPPEGQAHTGHWQVTAQKDRDEKV